MKENLMTPIENVVFSEVQIWFRVNFNLLCYSFSVEALICKMHIHFVLANENKILELKLYHVYVHFSCYK